MRRIAAFVLALSISSAGLMAPRPSLASPADSPDINGSWRLVIIPTQPGEVDFAILDVKATNGKIAANVTAAMQALGAIESADGTVAGDKITIQLPTQGEPTSFRGVLDKDGKKAKGTFKFRGGVFPGRMERTEVRVLARAQTSPLVQKIVQTRSISDPKERVARLRDLIGQNPDNPMNALAYGLIANQAEAAGLSAEEAGKLIGQWIDEARAYGPELVAETQSQAIKAMQGKKTYASLATETAQAAEKSLAADASTDLRYDLANMLANSAKLAGKDAIATEAEARAKEYDAKLDSEFHEKVPPFKPEAVAARSDGKGTRVMLMEIFTGSECPPCVAADVAFDALLKTFKPTEFIGLQYHLHIPRSDPMTNLDTIARQGYYGSEIGGTPSTFFNGKSENGDGGGPMSRAELKYKEYRKLIDPALAGEKMADIKLTATRTSDEVKIVASATASGGSRDAKLRLRLILVEESVHFPGGNKLRYHNNVVRAFPGGVDGKPLETGEANVEATVKLSDLRKAQDAYLAEYIKTPVARGPFSRPLPPVDLDDLAVVALVQDDADHKVWHAVQVEVKP
jgi:hypothetical protein